MNQIKYRLLLSLVAVFLLSSSAMALESASVNPIEHAQEGTTIEQRAEQTEWFFRYNNGKLQRRLWSKTYGKWLTDWIDCEP